MYFPEYSGISLILSITVTPGNYINKVITYFQNLKMTIISNLLLCLLSYLDSWGAQEWPLRMVGATVCGDYVYHSSRFSNIDNAALADRMAAEKDDDVSAMQLELLSDLKLRL